MHVTIFLQVKFKGFKLFEYRMKCNKNFLAFNKFNLLHHLFHRDIFFLSSPSHSKMYGRYCKDLGEYAKDEARRLRQLEKQRKKDDRARDKVIRCVLIYIAFKVDDLETGM